MDAKKQSSVKYHKVWPLIVKHAKLQEAIIKLSITFKTQSKPSRILQTRL